MAMQHSGSRGQATGQHSRTRSSALAAGQPPRLQAAHGLQTVHAVPVPTPTTSAQPQLHPQHHAAAAQPGQPSSMPAAGSSRPQPGRTSPALLAKRAQQARSSQALTQTIMSAQNWRDLEHIYQEQRGQFNHIHMSALMTRLAHLTTAPHASSNPGAKAQQPPSSARLRREMPAIRMLLSSVVPFIGMHMLSLAPRQLASIMWALGSLGYTPQPAWLVEWSGCVARKLHAFTPQDLCMSAWGVAACGATQLGAASGAPGALLQLCTAAVQPSTLHALRPRDVSNLLWALATAGMKPPQQVLQLLAAQTGALLSQQHAVTFAAQQQVSGTQARHAAATVSSSQQEGTELAGLGAARTAQAGGQQQAVMGDSRTWGSSSTQGAAGTAVLDRPQQSHAAASAAPGIGGPLTTNSSPCNSTRGAAGSGSTSGHQLPARFLPQELVTVAHSLALLQYRPGEQLLADCLDLFLGRMAEDHHLSSHVHAAATQRSRQHTAGAAAAAGPSDMAEPHVMGGQQQQQLPPRDGTAAAHAAPGQAAQHRHYPLMLWSLAKLRWKPPPAQVAWLLAASLGTHQLGAQHATTGSHSQHAPSHWRTHSKSDIYAGHRQHQQPLLQPSMGLQAWPSPGQSSSHSQQHQQQLQQVQLSGTDLAQLVWALGALHFDPPAACKQKLLRAVHAALLATARAAGVAVEGAGAPSKPTKPRRHGRLQACKLPASAKQRRQARWHPLRQLHRAQRKQQQEAGDGPARAGAATTTAMPAAAAVAAHTQPPAAAAAASIGGGLAGCGDLGDLDEEDVQLVLEPGEVAVVLRGLCHLCRHQGALDHQPDSSNSSHQLLPAQLVQAVQAALSAIAPELQQLSPARILRLAAAVGRLRVTPPADFSTALAGCVRQFVGVLPPSQLVWLMVSLVWMGRPVLPGFVHLLTHRAVQLMQGGSVAATPGSTLQRHHHQQQQQQQQQHLQLDQQQRVQWHPGSRAAATAPQATAAAAATAAASIPEPRWPGSISELVLLLWALRRLGSPALPLAWSDVVVRAVGQAAPGLRPQQLGRVVDAVRKLRLRPQVRVALRTSRTLLATAAARAALLRCDELCGVEDVATSNASSSTNTNTSSNSSSRSSPAGDGADRSAAAVNAARRGSTSTVVRACGHLHAIPTVLRAWFRRLAAQQRRATFRSNRHFPRSLRRALLPPAQQQRQMEQAAPAVSS